MSESFLVFVIKPSPDVRDEIDRVRKSLGIDDRYGTDRLHATLLPLGPRAAFGEAALGVAMSAAAALRQAPFRIVFDRIEAGILRGSDRIAGLCRFQQTLTTALAEVGLAIPTRSRFQPHITLSYTDRSTGNHAIDGISWMVDHFLLIESLQGEGCHVALGRWPLRAG